MKDQLRELKISLVEREKKLNGMQAKIESKNQEITEL